MSNITVVTTFPDHSWDVYAKQMLQSFVQYWPKEVPLLVALDDDLILPDVEKILRPKTDGVVVGWTEDHGKFVERNKDKDDPQNYRKQVTRFCHKVFALYDAYNAALEAKKGGAKDVPRYLIWMDADVVTTRAVTLGDIEKCLPKEGDAVAYLGRKDWEHSECGWLAFDLENGGGAVIEELYDNYIDDSVLSMEQQHDSWVFDRVLASLVNVSGKALTYTNLTADKPGMEIWPQSPMAAWSIHYKGPAAKQNLFSKTPQQEQMIPGRNFVMQLQNAIPAEDIRKHIEENQKIIKNWLTECTPNKETIVVVSAGPLLVPEDVRPDYDAGNKIVAVKHALKPLRDAGIIPWACILLDPRPHVASFVENADTDVKWFVASQVNPIVTQALLDQGCEVWGYHAAVAADEGHLTEKQPASIVHGGSATATRGLHLLHHLGFRKFHLYGYDLSYADKPNLSTKDDRGQPKYIEFSVGLKNKYVDSKRHFYTEPQLVAQFEEMNELLKDKDFQIEAFGDGVVPFISKLIKLTNLRQERLKCIMDFKPTSYKRLLRCKTRKIKSLSINLPKICRKIRRKRQVSSK